MNRDGVIIHLYGCPTTEIIGGLTITEGASIALIGPNGAGKTSILRYIAFGRAPYPINTCKGTAGGFPIEKPRDSVKHYQDILYS